MAYFVTIIAKCFYLIVKYAIWDSLTFIAAIPASGNVIGFKKLLPPAVKYSDKIFPDIGNSHFKFIINAISVGAEYIWCKYIIVHLDNSDVSPGNSRITGITFACSKLYYIFPALRSLSAVRMSLTSNDYACSLKLRCV
jgi:hypothetical protein